MTRFKRAPEKLINDGRNPTALQVERGQPYAAIIGYIIVNFANVEASLPTALSFFTGMSEEDSRALAGTTRSFGSRIKMLEVVAANPQRSREDEEILKYLIEIYSEANQIRNNTKAR